MKLRSAKWRRVPQVSVVLALVVGVSGLVGAPQADAAGVTISKAVSRYYVNADGSHTVVNSPHTVNLTVDRTTNLRSLQLIHVSWSGARPTAGIVGDQNSDLAQNEEYPMVLLECRGEDSASAPTAKRLTPNTCWTQFADERFSYGYNNYPAWRSDAMASAASRAAIVGAPATESTQCKNILIGTANQHWLPFAGADGSNFQGGPFGCAGLAPEAAPTNLSSLSLPSNETFAATSLSGTGQTEFDVFTGEDHNSLGCSQSVPCSLVAIPIEGINCDATGALLPSASQPTGSDLTDAQTNCQTGGNFKPGQTYPAGKSGADAVDGTLWWSPSNWNNRITVPLTFAPPDNACGLANTQTPINVYGSELLIQATTQWAPHFCLDPKLFNFNHVQTPEPQAANLLNTDNIEAAFISRPPDGGFTSPTVKAPVAITGFGIAFAVDDANGHPLAQLRLDARLIAKLLTESYPDLPLVKSTDSALAPNPYNIAFDPEFQALNPNIPQKLQDAASTLLALNTDSDVIWALTSYINADPDARAWLAGQADPWGMTVNPAYKNIALPVNNWPLLDAFKPAFSFGVNPCFYSNPVPYLPLVASPTARLFSIGQDMQFALAQSQTVCVTPSPDPGSLAGAKVVAQGRQQVGARFMLGVVSLGDAAREGLHLASLETQKSLSAADKFIDGSGRTFVAPAQASLLAAAKLLTPDTASGTWAIPYATMRSDAAGSQAYPGTMVVYLAAPTRGLKAADAGDLSKLITFAATAGQRPGTMQGTLPEGYLPMTAATGLVQLANYSQLAACDVAAQRGIVPALSAQFSGQCLTASPTPAPGSTTRTTSTSASSSSGAAVGSTAATGTGSGASTHPKASPSANPSGSAITSAAAAGYTSRLGTGAVGAALPVLTGLVVVAGLAAIGLRLSGRRQR